MNSFFDLNLKVTISPERIPHSRRLREGTWYTLSMSPLSKALIPWGLDWTQEAAGAISSTLEASCRMGFTQPKTIQLRMRRNGSSMHVVEARLGPHGVYLRDFQRLTSSESQHALPTAS